MKTLENTSVIHATLRPEDLLPAFLHALEEIDQRTATRFNSELISLGFSYSQCGACGLGNRAEWPSDFSDDLAHEIIDDLANALNDHAPEGFYFGAHPGDGSDFGFWQIEE